MELKWQKRFCLILLLMTIVTSIVFLVVNALQSNIELYITPTEIKMGKVPSGRAFRVGGMVQEGSLHRDGLKSEFYLTDTNQSVFVKYEGVLPNLFQEGQGAVVLGRLKSDTFYAEEVLAKHDENYMPPGAYDAIAKGKELSADK